MLIIISCIKESNQLTLDYQKKELLEECFKKLRSMQVRTRQRFTFPLNTRLTQPQIYVQHAFYTVGLNYSGLLFLKYNTGVPCKAWFLLFNCTSSRSVYLELVLDITSPTFIRAFKRFSSRCGLPDVTLSNNFQT